MAEPRSDDSLRLSGSRRSWSWRNRSKPPSRSRNPELPEPPAEDLKTAEWRVLGLVAELNVRVENWACQSPDRWPLIEQCAATFIQFGLESGARMLCFELGSSQMRVRARVDGELVEKIVLPRSLHAPLLAVLKDAAGLKPLDTRRPEEGMIRVSLGKQEYTLRLSCLPDVQGEVVNLHLPPTDARPLITSLGGLGMFSDVLGALGPTLDGGRGMIVVAGVTTSGVTQTLYSMAHRINARLRLTMSVEDPVEYLLPGVTQLSVDATQGLPFAHLLRTCLREQPDTVMLSDLPDPETARLALNAGRVGRTILAGFPGDRASSVPSDLIAMGASPYELASGLACVLVQHRVRRLCEACKRRDPGAVVDVERMAMRFQAWDQAPYERAGDTPGRCSECGYTGYKGYVTLFEVLPVTAAVRAAILRGDSPVDLEALANREGMITLAADGQRRLNMGDISRQDLLDVLKF